MTKPTLEERKQQILEYEENLARRLARQVFEKPTPPIWMILIPIFFVFYGWKLKEYSNGLKTFVDNYLISRKRALELACDAVERKREPAIEDLMTAAGTLPEQARPLYRAWLTLQVEHYRNLLLAAGATVPERIRCHYRTKANYLLVGNRLVSEENVFNAALLPDIDGDSEDIRFIAGRIERFAADLHRREVEEIFA